MTSCCQRFSRRVALSISREKCSEHRTIHDVISIVVLSFSDYLASSSPIVLVANELCTFHARRTCFIMISYCPSFSFSFYFLNTKKKVLWPTSVVRLFSSANYCCVALSLSSIVSLTMGICIVFLIVDIKGLNGLVFSSRLTRMFAAKFMSRQA